MVRRRTGSSPPSGGTERKKKGNCARLRKELQARGPLAAFHDSKKEQEKDGVINRKGEKEGWGNVLTTESLK